MCRSPKSRLADHFQRDTGIDVRREEEFMAPLAELNQRLPIVMVSHDVSLVCEHLKRVACINRRLTWYQGEGFSPQLIEELYYGRGVTVEPQSEGGPG